MAKNTKPIDWAARAEACRRRLTPAGLRKLARKLGVSEDSLVALGVGLSTTGAWTFPESDGQGNVIGILRRYRDGTKKVMPRGQRGLYLPQGWQDGKGPIFIPEGASDVAALLTLGLRAVGRPSCAGGVDHLLDLLADTDAEVLIVGENDQKEDGRWPGRDGARRVASALAPDLDCRVRWTMPPEGCKDVREYLTREGAK
jgi:hypothetical protein